MSTPPDEPPHWLYPFAPEPEDDSSSDSTPPPAPPLMHSPYRPDEALPGQAPRERQPPRFPSLFGSDHHHGTDHHGTGHGGSHQQPPAPMPPAPPFQQRPPQGAPPSWGMGDQQYPVPPQFSYNPELQPAFPQPAPGRPRNARRAIIGVSAIALLTAGIVGAVVLQGSSTKPSATGGPTTNILGKDTHTAAGKAVPAAWTAPASGDAATVVGSWLVNKKTVVRGDAGALKAYDAETGKQLWTYPVPGQGTSICQMSQLTVSGIGIVQYGPAGNCNTITAIDNFSGKQVWTQTLGVTPGSAPGTTPMMAMGGDVVAGQTGTSVTVWGAADGKQLWTDDLAKLKPPCKPNQLAAKASFVALIEDCGTGPIAVRKDAHTGADLWRTPLPPDGLGGARITLVEAALPTIVHVESQAIDRYYTFDAQGKLKATIDGTGDFGKLDLNVGPQGLQQPLPHVVSNTFIAPTADKDPTTAMAAFDLSSGKKQWQIPATATGPVIIAAMDSDKLTVFDAGTVGSSPRLTTYAVYSGGTVDSGFNETLASDWGGPAAAAYVTGDRLIVLPAAPMKGADVVAFALSGGGATQ